MMYWCHCQSVCGMWKIETAIEVDAGVTFALRNHEDDTTKIQIKHVALHTLTPYSVVVCGEALPHHG